MNFLPQIINPNIYPWGNFFVAPAGIAIAYSIFKHQAFDIKIAIEKSIIYSILIVAVSIFYLILVIGLERVFANLFHYQSIGISIAAAFGIGLLVFPLRNKIQQLMDRYFFSGTTTEIYNRNKMLEAEVAQTQRLKTAATLASGLAHEIKNPLTAINTFSEYLSTKKDDPEFLENFSRIVGMEAKRINELVEEMVDFAKPTETKMQPTRIYDIIDFETKFLNSRLVQYNIQLDIRLTSPQDLQLIIDARKIKQALLNILMNAIDAMPNGGTLTIRDEIIADQTPGHKDTKTPGNKEAEIQRDREAQPQRYPEPAEGSTTSHEPSTMSDKQCHPEPAEGSTYQLSITDTGNGIAAKDIPHLFDPFFTKKDGGTGLGLSVTYGIIEEHDGKIWAQSTLGQGTTFVIQIPL